MRLVEAGGLTVLQPALLPAAAAFTTRGGGISVGPYASLNLGAGSGDDPAAVATNSHRLASALGFRTADLARLRQVHGAEVAVVERPGPPGWPIGEFDAAVTDRPDVVLLVLAADCVPVLLVDPERPAIGAVHAGWRGVAADAPGAAVRRMVEAFGSRPASLRAAIGPCIGPCCYEVDEPVAEAFAAAGLPLDGPAAGVIAWPSPATGGAEAPVDTCRPDGAEGLRASGPGHSSGGAVPSAARTHGEGHPTSGTPSRIPHGRPPNGAARRRGSGQCGSTGVPSSRLGEATASPGDSGRTGGHPGPLPLEEAGAPAPAEVIAPLEIGVRGGAHWTGSSRRPGWTTPGGEPPAGSGQGPERAAARARSAEGRRHWRLDLVAAVRARLLAAGLQPAGIDAAGLCTSCRADLFFSHRRDGPRTGRQAGLVWLRGGAA